MQNQQPRVLLDTDVVSFLFRRDSRAKLYAGYLDGRLPAICFMTLAELDYWTLRRSWGPTRRAELHRHLRRFAIYPYQRELCLEWARVTDQATRTGRPIGCGDAWIAATARLYNLPLVTHNARDYAGVAGLTVWTAAIA